MTFKVNPAVVFHIKVYETHLSIAAGGHQAVDLREVHNLVDPVAVHLPLRVRRGRRQRLLEVLQVPAFAAGIVRRREFRVQFQQSDVANSVAECDPNCRPAAYFGIMIITSS